MKRHLLPALLLAACVGGAVAAAAQGPSAAEIASQVQQKYDRVRDFSADFTHEAESGVLRKKLVERGSVMVKKPGKMRWDIQGARRRKLFVSDGVRMYMHTPADNQVIVSPVPADDQATTAVLFLTGKGNLTRDFTVSFDRRRAGRHLRAAAPAEARGARLRLAPARGRPVDAPDPVADGRRQAGHDDRRSRSRISRKTSDCPIRRFSSPSRAVPMSFRLATRTLIRSAERGGAGAVPRAG